MEYLECLRQLNRTITAVSASRAPSGFDAASGTGALDELARAIRMLQAEQVAVAALCESAGAFGADGFKDMASWMRGRQGVSGRAAKDLGDAATAVLSSPKVAEAIASGELSAENAASLKDLAERTASGDADPAVLDQLLQRASQQSDAFRRDVKRSDIYGSGDEEAAALRRRARSKVTVSPSDGGMMTTVADLDPERSAVVLNAIDAIVDEIWRAGRGDAGSTAATVAGVASAVPGSDLLPLAQPPSRELSHLRADALVEMARRSLAGVDSGQLPSSSGNSRRSEPQVVVLVDFETLRDGLRREDSRCELEDGMPISPGAARRLACNAGIIPVVMSGQSQPLDVGRTSRFATPAQRIAAMARTHTCEFDGCTVPVKWTEAHHVRWWFRDDGKTDLENLVYVCIAHHVIIHQGGWTVTRNKGRPGVTTRNPDGEIVRNGTVVIDRN